MIGISRLYCGKPEPMDGLRYGRAAANHRLKACATPKPVVAAANHRLKACATPKPVVVYNCTRRCNLACIHCYSTSSSTSISDELSTDQAKAMLDDLAAFGAGRAVFGR